MKNSTGTPKFNSMIGKNIRVSSSGAPGKKKTKVPKVDPHHFLAYDYEARRAEMLESEEYQFAHFSGDDCAEMLMRLLQDFHHDDDDDDADAADACQHWIAHSRYERALNGYFGG